VTIRRGQKKQSVSIYDFDMDEAESNLDILRFPSTDKLWIDFVHQNRRDTYTGKIYALIIGPVANDDIFATLLIEEA
jgi:hypothetical protein